MDLVKLVTTLVEGVVVNKEDVSVKEFSSDDAITIEILVKEEDMGRLIGKNGNTLKALETIVKQRVNSDLKIHIYLILDVENYREKQEKRLIHLAKSLAKEVTKTKLEVHLENMNAYDRRIIHNALTNFKGIKTESEGEEPNRHIVIKPL